MSEGMIRWKHGDFVRLGRAVSDFNKKIRQVRSEENSLYLPDEVNYQDLKGDITTRRELNRILNSLKRFQREGAEDLYVTNAGEQMTVWERKELGIQSRIGQRHWSNVIEKYNNETVEDTGFTRAQMGSTRLREMESIYNNIGSSRIESLTGEAFKRLKRRLRRYRTF